MDGNFNNDDAHSLTAEKISTTDAMALAEKSLGGRKRWRGDVSGLLGLLRRGFSIESVGKLDSQGLVFDETLQFDDGETQLRSWHISQSAGGLAVKADGIELLEPGKVKNHILLFVYRLKFGSLTFRYRDKFYLNSEGDVMNEGKAFWCGLPVMTIRATGKTAA